MKLRALCLLALAADALACGYCIEDKIAAVYDHGVVVRAAEQKHPVVFFALVGDFPADAATHHALVAAAESIKGVDAASIRVSLASASLALAFDPQATSLPGVDQALSRKLAARRISLGVLRVVEGPVLGAAGYTTK
jgi:hypothetical protein